MQNLTQNLTPISWGKSLLYFGIPALMMAACFYILMPYLERKGMLPYYAYSISLGLPLLLLLAASLIFYQAEGHPMNWQSFLARFRYEKMTLKDWLWTGGVFTVEMLIYTQFARISSYVIKKGWIRLPDSLPTFVNPSTIFSTETLDTAVGSLEGNWMVLVFSFILLVINVLGEEFWWRGFILPRQELAFGKWVWVVHGVFWAFFHSYKYWDLLNQLPLALGLSFVVYRLRNNTPGLAIHFVTNGVGLLPILLGIFG